MEDYCCPMCEGTNIDVFDEKECEVNLEDESVYLRQAMTCNECGHEFTMTLRADLKNIKIDRY